MRKKKNGDKRRRNLETLFLKADEISGSSDSFFAIHRPLCLEIGCGKGDFICKMSQNEPDFNYIAVERAGDVILAAAEKYAVSRSLGSLDPHGRWLGNDGNLYDGETYPIPMEQRGNVRFISGDAAELLPLFPKSSVRTIYANFSDPWSKKGYESRRLTYIDRLREYADVLEAGGELVIKTDNDGFFDYSMESVSGGPFEIVAWTRDLDCDPRFSEGNVETEYERNFKSKGVKIKSLRARVIK